MYLMRYSLGSVCLHKCALENYERPAGERHVQGGFVVCASDLLDLSSTGRCYKCLSLETYNWTRVVESNCRALIKIFRRAGHSASEFACIHFEIHHATTSIVNLGFNDNLATK
jgi:hypothetical protein